VKNGQTRAAAQAHGDAAGRLPSDRDVKIHLNVDNYFFFSMKIKKRSTLCVIDGPFPASTAERAKKTRAAQSVIDVAEIILESKHRLRPILIL
jgi:hypothetical protein